jgi:putative membrane-bound dehydrogenase-like protein
MLGCLRLTVLLSLCALIGRTATAQQPGRRLQVMFFGAPTANHAGHDPITRYRVLKQALGVDGIDLTYVEDPAVALRAEWLDQFDAVLMYGNWNQHTPMKREQLTALLRYVDDGGGFVPVHCASACFGGSPLFVKLVGGRFARHGGEEFAVDNVAVDHEILRGLEPFRAWDETYEHDSLADDRQVLQTRDGEPWTWLRRQGKGRVFYTASGHDHRVWDLPQFHQLLRRGILWSVGDRRELLQRLELPQLETEQVSLPGYRRREEITVAQKPLSPAESQKLAQVPVSMTLQLFASEPDIVNPICVAWDHRGRAFVIETIDYPNNLQRGEHGHDRITICEDTDGDGRADRFTRFADQLSIPTSLCFAEGGVLCTNGRDLLFLQDTDGDDRADVREVLFSGFHMGDTHAGVSNLRYGFDGWIYATVGYSGFTGEVGGVPHDFSQAVFRFLPDGSALEVLQGTTNNTWGLGFTESFDVLGSTANGNPSFYLSHARKAYERCDLEQPRTPPADRNPKFFPSSQDIRQVDQFDRFTAGAGHAFYTARRLPDEYHDRVAFVCGPTGKLVGSFTVERRGAGFRAELSPNNLFCSADAWSSPVCAEVGPDGAVWICDWYNLIIQHNPTPSVRSAGIAAKTGRGNAYETPLRDKQHGHIWRVFPTGSADDEAPQLDPEDPATLLAGLSHDNLLWRLHAQRLLFEFGDDVSEQLEPLVAAAGTAAPHALQLLAQLQLQSPAVVEAALRSRSEAVRRTAIAVADVDAIKRRYVRDGTIDAQGRELAEVLVALTMAAADPEIGTAIYQVGKRGGDALLDETAMRDAWNMAANRQAVTVLAAAEADGVTFAEPAPPTNLLPNPGFEQVVDGAPAAWTDLRRYSGAAPERVTVRSSDRGRNGGRCLELRCDAFIDAGLACTVEVEPGTRYRLSAWLRTEGATPRGNAPGMMINVHGGPHSAGLKGDQDWTELTVEFEATRRRHVVHCLFGGYGGARGTAFYDDVSLVAIGNKNTFAGALRALHQGDLGDRPAEPIVRQHQPDPAVHARGKQVFQRTCIACHGVDGRGVPGTFPPLDGSSFVTGDPAVAARIVLHGLMGPVEVAGKRYQNVMAPLGPTLDDQQVADVLTLVRQSWSNDAAPVAADAVRRVREQHQDRVQMWTAAELAR